MEGERIAQDDVSDARVAAVLLSALGYEPGQSPADDLPPEITGIITRRVFEGGDTLMIAGEASDSIFILLEGRLLVETADGTLIGEVRPGETVGEIGVIAGTPRGATVRAVRASVAAMIRAEDFRDFVHHHPGIGLSVARTMIERERRAARPRHPAIRPDTIAVIALQPGLDLSGLVDGIEATGIEPLDRDRLPGAARHVSAERLIQPVDISDPEGAAQLLRRSDEVVMVGRLDGDTGRAAADELIEAVLPDTSLPRRTLVLLRPAEAAPPRDTSRWLEGRRVDRHIHVREGVRADVNRLARLLFGRAVGLVMAGGGARGAAHLGAIRALAELGIEPDIVGGTSIGAAMAAWYAMGLRGTDLEDAAKAVFVEHGSPTGDWTALPLISLVKGEKTRKLCRRAVRRAMGHDAHIEDLPHPYFAVAANMSTQEQRVFQTGTLWRALSATYSIPGVLPPVPIDGALYIDGGVVNNLPVDVMETFDAAQIISVDLLGETRAPRRTEAVPSGLQALIDKARPRKARRFRVPGILTTLLTATMIGSLERQRAMSLRADISLRPDLPRIGLLDWKKFESIIEMGYESCKAQLADIDPKILESLKT